jgi:ferredoxin-NADP reductase
MRAAHLEVTASSPRATKFTACALAEVWSGTPLIRLLRFRVVQGSEVQSLFKTATLLPDCTFDGSPPPSLGYQAGQWVDLVIPGVAEVGGYSLVSAPSGGPFFDLAVKKARHPPAAWVHDLAAPGDLVGVRVGGDFTLPRLQAQGYSHLVMLAGGVGINPLYSMLLGLATAGGREASSARWMPSISILYTARTPSELLFAQQIKDLEAGELRGRLTAQCWATREEGEGQQQPSQRRITPSMVLDALKGGKVGGRVGVVICGPPQFSDSMMEACLVGGVPKEDVLLERWW